MIVQSASKRASSSAATRRPFNRAADNNTLRGLARGWFLFLLRGIAAILFGLLALSWPEVTLLSLIFLYGFYLIADGVFAIVSSFVGGITAGSWWLAAAGLLSVVAGIFTLARLDVTTLLLLYVIAGWAIASGAIYIVGAIALWKEIALEWLLLGGGIVSIVFGVLLSARPGIAEVLIWIIGSYAILYGILLIGLSLRLREYVLQHRDAEHRLKA